jgi:ADP-heptose:LPS heptosyltransferase
MDKWIFENWLSPGDLVLLTAAIRELHHAYPGRFQTDVRTSCPALWENNPYLTRLEPSEPGVRSLLTHYPLIHQCNDAPYHFIHGFIDYLNRELGLCIRPTSFKGDIHLSAEEQAAPSVVEALGGHAAGVAGASGPSYWVIAAGGKYDYTIKWWHRRRWQAVVDHFRDRILFVQVGDKGHYHPPLKGVLDLRGRTNLRELIRLVYHADGVLCPVTFLMHLAAAVPLPPGRRRLRSCVVVAGGREPAHWEQYPGHQFLHTIGALDCCATGGCWKARTVPLGDGSPLDAPSALCTSVTGAGLPACMDLITTEAVCAAIERSGLRPTSAAPNHEPAAFLARPPNSLVTAARNPTFHSTL